MSARRAWLASTLALLLALGFLHESLAQSSGGARSEAIRRYESLLADPSPAVQSRRDEMQFRLGLLYLEQAQEAGPNGGQGLYQRSLSYLDPVLQKSGSPYREEALYYRAIALEETGRHSDAMQAFRTLIRDYPSGSHSAEVWFRIGNDAIQRDQTSEAMSAYAEVLRRDDLRYRDQAAYMYAWSAFSLRREDQARTTLVDLLNRMTAAGQTGEGLYQESIELLAKVVRSSGNLAVYAGPFPGQRPAWVEPALRRTAELFRETSAYAEAARAYEQILRDFPDAEDVDDLEQKVVDTWLKAGDASRAELARQRLIARHRSGDRIREGSTKEIAPLVRDSALFLHEQAREGKRADLYQKAVEEYSMLAESLPEGEERTEALFLRAEALKEAGNERAAAAAYQEVAATRDPKKGEEAAFRRIALLEDLHERGGATVDDLIAAYEDYFRVYRSPREVELRLRYAGTLYDQKRFAESIEAGAAVVGRVTDPETRQKLELQLARAAFAAGDYAQCGTWVKRLLAEPNLAPDRKAQAVEVHATALYQQAESLKSQPLEAAGHYELLSRLYPQHKTAAAALYNAAVLLRDQNEKARAVQLFRRLIDEFPQSDLSKDAMAAATELYAETGDHRSASLLLERAAGARGASPERAELFYEAATRAKEGGSSERAAELYEKYLGFTAVNDIRATIARLTVAKAKLAAGKEAEAERFAEDAIQRAPFGQVEDEQRLQVLLAEARLLLGEVALRRYDRVRLTEPLDRSIVAKQKALEEAVRHLTTAAGYGFADVSLASTYKIGYLQLAFADALNGAPRPRNLRPDEMKRYEELLSEQTRPYREAAEKAFRLTLERADKAGIENEWTARARSALGRFGGAASASVSP